MSEQKSIKVKFATYAQNGGDGSVIIKFFPSVSDAEDYAEKDNERYCEDTELHELEFDLEGNLLTKDKW